MLALALGAARSAGVDRAAAFAMMSRSWQLLAAPVTLMVIASRFTPDVQGYYYTFVSLLALQAFAELGLSIVIVSLASHEWSRLFLDSAGRLAGDTSSVSRLVGFGRLVFSWYAIAATLFVVLVGPIGHWFLSRAGTADVAWQAPWTALVLLTGVQLALLAFTALLEGCNQVATVQRFRLIQAVGSTIAFWIAAMAGLGLWAAVAIAGVRVATDIYLVAIRYGRFFSAFRRQHAGPRMSWRRDVWPMQWRLGLSGVVNYFAFSLFTPVMFTYHGAVMAGQMGMTMQVVGGIQALALVFITTRVPQFGMLVARGDYLQLDPLWRRSSRVSVGVMAVGGAGIVLLVWGLETWGLTLADRLLGPWQTMLLVLTYVLLQVSQCQTAYIRAHRRELIVVLSVSVSLAIGASVWLFGSLFGATGALLAYLTVIAVGVIWQTAIWSRFRADMQAALVA